ncbi:DUF262 domain-containing protein [Pseudomonas asiatica]|uniref:DUF262 domain-containing protein n=1 Tax=Pseudomonas asiatica TaxID=2219225 RepID=A0A9X4HXE9_9PSED|nr:DUF262 domain-containing protein [Pseudomonas asiatica]MDD2109464.1 DUF262 domain-containing protein [Pseudomonas asiatica]
MQLSEYDLGFRFKKNTFTVSGLMDRYEEGGISLYPDHIYSKPWSNRAKSIFIESIIVGMPTAEIWCEESGYGEISVLDGTQRIQSIIDFCKNNFSLSSLKLLPGLEDSYFEDLPYRFKSTFLNRAELYFTIISYDTHPSLKFELFKRINSHSRFPVQAARNFAFRDHFNFIRHTQEHCEDIIAPEEHFNFLSPRIGYIQAANYDELFLLISALTLSINDEIEANQPYEDFLDAAAMTIHFRSVGTDALLSDIIKYLGRIKRALGKKILFDTSFSSARRRMLSTRLDDLKLTSSQIADLYILALRHEINHASVGDVIETGRTKLPMRSSRYYYRQLFG